MMNMNASMLGELRKTQCRGLQLPDELSALLAAGFVEVNGCAFLTSLIAKDTNASGDDFPDRTGYECFVNSLHIDDYVESDFLECACLFVSEAFKQWRAQSIPSLLQAIISYDEFGSLVKFHVVRSGESWVDEDIDSYEDAILVLDSGGTKFLSELLSGKRVQTTTL